MTAFETRASHSGQIGNVAFPPFSATQLSRWEWLFLCRFLGRLHEVAIHVRRRQASEKRQGTKSRLVGRGGWSRLYGEFGGAGGAGMGAWGKGLGGREGGQGLGGELDGRERGRGVGRGGV